MRNNNCNSENVSSLETSEHKIARGAKGEAIGPWYKHAEIRQNHFRYKSLSNWSFNPVMGCGHGCTFCYVPSTSATKQAPLLQQYGVLDPDQEWGNYALLRQWDERKFMTSLSRAEAQVSERELPEDGNHAILFSSTTDPYQVFHHSEPARAKELSEGLARMVRRALELIRDYSDLNVRILTRSPLAKCDFDLYQSFGDRLLFGLSLPTLDYQLARIYEPQAPSPAQRLRTLQEAKAAGLHVYVAVAPTYPECDADDLETTLRAVRDLDPLTVFHEPINIRAENVRRIEAEAARVGVDLRSQVFATRSSWRRYALDSLQTVEAICEQLGLQDRLHLWPDRSLGTKVAMKEVDDAEHHQHWLAQWWSRVSEWPRDVDIHCGFVD